MLERCGLVRWLSNTTGLMRAAFIGFIYLCYGK